MGELLTAEDANKPTIDKLRLMREKLESRLGLSRDETDKLWKCNSKYSELGQEIMSLNLNCVQAQEAQTPPFSKGDAGCPTSSPNRDRLRGEIISLDCPTVVENARSKDGVLINDVMTVVGWERDIAGRNQVPGVEQPQYFLLGDEAKSIAAELNLTLPPPGPKGE